MNSDGHSSDEQILKEKNTRQIPCGLFQKMEPLGTSELAGSARSVACEGLQTEQGIIEKIKAVVKVIEHIERSPPRDGSIQRSIHESPPRDGSIQRSPPRDGSIQRSIERSPPRESIFYRAVEDKSLIYDTPKKDPKNIRRSWASPSWDIDSPPSKKDTEHSEDFPSTMEIPIARKIKFESDFNENEHVIFSKKIKKTLNEWFEDFSILASSEIKKNIVVQVLKNGFLHLNNSAKNENKILGSDNRWRNLYDICQFYIILDCLFNRTDEIWKNCSNGVVLKTISYNNPVTEIKKNDPVVYCKLKVEEFETLFSELGEFIKNL